jgi:hypothetical protein
MTDKSPYAELAAALRHRIAIIADRELYENDPAGHLKELKGASEKITTLEKGLPLPIDPELAHFLARCSYHKALDHIQARHLAG